MLISFKANSKTLFRKLLVCLCVSVAVVYIGYSTNYSSQIIPACRIEDLENPSAPPHPPASKPQKLTNVSSNSPALKKCVAPEINASKSTKAKCTPRKHVMFLKTHKCAGTTVQNILYRFGMKNKLDFVLPSGGSHYITHTRDVNRKQLVAATDGQYDIITNHAVLSEALMKLLPSDAIKITSVRDPATHFGSIYDYYRIGNDVRLPNGKAGAEMFLADTTKYYFKYSPQPPYIHNQMLKDLGFPDRNSGNRTAVLEYISWLDKVFDLVMLTEYFSESIVLMRDFLCWRDEEVVSTILNKRPKAFSVKTAIADQIYAFNWQDKLLYDHFKAKLTRRIDKYGKDKMAQEVNRLKKITQDWVVECGIKEIPSSSKTKFKTWDNKATTFELKPQKWVNTSCVFLIIPEVAFHNKIKSAQLKRNEFGLLKHVLPVI